jgi:hypothetical protein
MADGPAYPPPQPVQRPGPGEAPPPSNVYGPAGTPSSGTAPGITVGKPATGGRRWWMVVVGILAILISVVPLVVGGVLLLAEGAVNIADAEAEDTFPDADLSFTADGGQQYDIFLSGRRVSEGDASLVNCQITHPDGGRAEVDGTVQAVGVEGAVSSVGSFDGVEGFTEIRCTGLDSGERIYVGRDRPGLELAGWVGIGAGVLGVLIGMALLFAGLFWRKPLPQQVTPIP